MIFSVIIAVLLVAALILYFVLNNKIKTPTIATEILINKYNKKIDKVNLLLKGNKVEINISKYKSFIEKSEINYDNIECNIETIDRIQKNYNVLNLALADKSKDQIEQTLKKLDAPCKIYQFAEELKTSEEMNKIFDMLGYKKTKLNFELQRYFGSQYFYEINDLLVCCINKKLLSINRDNIFGNKSAEYKLIIKENEEKESGKVFDVSLLTDCEILHTKVFVPQKENIVFLKSFIENKKKP